MYSVCPKYSGCGACCQNKAAKKQLEFHAGHGIMIVLDWDIGGAPWIRQDARPAPPWSRSCRNFIPARPCTLTARSAATRSPARLGTALLSGRRTHSASRSWATSTAGTRRQRRWTACRTAHGCRPWTVCATGRSINTPSPARTARRCSRPTHSPRTARPGPRPHPRSGHSRATSGTTGAICAAAPHAMYTARR